MAKIELKLRNPETEKVEVYSPKKFLGARIVRNLYKKQEELSAEDAGPLDQLDGMVDFFIEEVFDNQFTQDDFYDGIESHKLSATIEKLTEQVTGVNPRSMVADPKIVN